MITDVAMPTEGNIVRMHSTLDTNGGKVWDERVHGSPFSAAEVHKIHQVHRITSWCWCCIVDHHSQHVMLNQPLPAIAAQTTDVEAAFKMIQTRLAECSPK